MTISAEIRYKAKLKHQGHELIKSISRLGVHKGISYSYLAKKLKYHKPQMHFQNIHNITTLLKMIEVLQGFHDKLERRREKKPLLPLIKRRIVRVKLPEPVKPRKKKKKHIFPHYTPPPGGRKYKDEALTPEQIKQALAELHNHSQKKIEVPPLKRQTVFLRIAKWFRMLQSKH